MFRALRRLKLKGLSLKLRAWGMILVYARASGEGILRLLFR